jgi:signal transduction histidine kinase
MSALTLVLLAGIFVVLTVAAFNAQKFARLQMEFVASVSHDLRTPLAAIFSAGENMQDGVVTHGPELKSYGSLIMNQSRQLMKHIDRILLFASIQSEMSRYNTRQIDVLETLKSVRDHTAVLIHQGNFIVEEEIESNLPQVLGDPFALCICLENLISNAVKYSRNDRRIRIVAKLQRSAGGAETVAISVQDFGIGIDASELKSIFEPFYRGREALNAQIYGTGLGLSLAKHFVGSMGGSLSVASKVGVGSVFTLHLSAAREGVRELLIATPESKRGEANE